MDSKNSPQKFSESPLLVSLDSRSQHYDPAKHDKFFLRDGFICYDSYGIVAKIDETVSMLGTISHYGNALSWSKFPREFGVRFVDVPAISANIPEDQRSPYADPSFFYDFSPLYNVLNGNCLEESLNEELLSEKKDEDTPELQEGILAMVGEITTTLSEVMTEEEKPLLAEHSFLSGVSPDTQVISFVHHKMPTLVSRIYDNLDDLIQHDSSLKEKRSLDRVFRDAVLVDIAAQMTEFSRKENVPLDLTVDHFSSLSSFNDLLEHAPNSSVLQRKIWLDSRLSEKDLDLSLTAFGLNFVRAPQGEGQVTLGTGEVLFAAPFYFDRTISAGELLKELALFREKHKIEHRHALWIIEWLLRRKILKVVSGSFSLSLTSVELADVFLERGEHYFTYLPYCEGVNFPRYYVSDRHRVLCLVSSLKPGLRIDVASLRVLSCFLSIAQHGYSRDNKTSLFDSQWDFLLSSGILSTYYPTKRVYRTESFDDVVDDSFYWVHSHSMMLNRKKNSTHTLLPKSRFYAVKRGQSATVLPTPLSPDIGSLELPPQSASSTTLVTGSFNISTRVSFSQKFPPVDVDLEDVDLSVETITSFDNNEVPSISGLDPGDVNDFFVLAQLLKDNSGNKD